MKKLVALLVLLCISVSYSGQLYDISKVKNRTKNISKVKRAPYLRPNDIDGCVLYINFDEGTGTSAGNDAWISDRTDGTITGASWVTGIFDDALAYDGSSNRYVNAASYSALDISNNLTMYVYLKKESMSSFRRVYGKQSSNTDCCYAIGVRNGQEIGLAYYTSGWREFYTGYNFSNGTWYHVVFTFTTSQVQCFIDGESVYNVTGTYEPLPSRSSVPINVGVNFPSNEKWNGTIDEIALYNRVLTANEIKRMYQERLRREDYNG